MRKSVCLFCMRSHRRKPKLCQAKGDVVRAYLNAGIQMWQVMYGIESGLIKLEAEALERIHNSKRKS
jgi:hypothetical protein